MKKIILFFNIIFIIINFHILTACQKITSKNQYINKNEDNIWAILPSNTINKKITSSDIWNQLTNPFNDIENQKKWNNNPNQWDGPTKIKTTIGIVQILSVAILANSEKLISINDHNNINQIADYKDLIKILKNQWKILNDNIEQQIINKKQSFKNDYQKQWKEKYYNWLIENYSNNNNEKTINNQNYEIEENNYKASLMIQGGDNVSSASTILTNILLNNNMRQYNITNSAVIGNLLKHFNEWLKNNNEADEWNINNPDLRNSLAIGYSWNNTSNMFDQNIFNINYVNNKLLNMAKQLATEMYDLNKFAAKYIPVDAPIFQILNKNQLGEITLNSQIFQPGLLSLFQKYILEQWYQNEKPLAISQIIYSFKDNNNAFQDGIHPNDFTDNTQMHIEKDINNLKNNSWENFYKDKENEKINNVSQGLLTLNNNNNDDIFKSNIVKINIYQNFNKNPTNPPNTINHIIEAINRSNNNNMSAVWKLQNLDKIIAFIDIDGLHILHIDGNEFLLNNEKDSYNNYNMTWQFKSLDYAHNIFENNNYNPFDDIKIKSNMNTQFEKTPYLQYLVNMSIFKKKNNNIRIQFDVLNEIQSYAKINIDSENNTNIWWLWIYDFFDNLQKNILKKQDNNWIKSLITFKDINGDIFDIKWFENIIDSIKNTLIGGSYNKLTSIINIENNNIEKYSNNYISGKFNVENILSNIQLNDQSSPNIWFIEYEK